MGVPLRQSIKVGTYVARQKLAHRDKFPLIVELEPLFACNLECSGCGKIQYPTEILRKRLSVEQAVAAMEECGAPMVSIAGGEPLLHPEIEKMTNALLERKLFVYLCTNALLLERKLDRFTPHPAFSWVMHIDGLKERHDESVNRDGTFDKAVAAIKAAKEKGFRVATNTTFFSTDSPRTVQEVLDFLNDELEVDTMMISPGYAYEKAPDQVHFLGVNQSSTLFKDGVCRQTQALAAEPQPSVPRLPGRQGRVRVHPLGDPFLFGFRLAAALLLAGRRLYRDLQGAHRDDGLVQVRARPGSSLPQLHGPLRVRTQRRAGHRRQRPGVFAGLGQRPLDAQPVEGEPWQGANPEGTSDGLRAWAGPGPVAGGPQGARYRSIQRDRGRREFGPGRSQAPEWSAPGRDGRGPRAARDQLRGHLGSRPAEAGAAAAVVAAAADALGGLTWSSPTPARDGAGPSSRCRQTKLDWLLDINLRAPLHLAHAAADYLRDSDAGGQLVLVGSIAGLVGVPDEVAYCAAKAGPARAWPNPSGPSGAAPAAAMGRRDRHPREPRARRHALFHQPQPPVLCARGPGPSRWKRRQARSWPPSNTGNWTSWSRRG